MKKALIQGALVLSCALGVGVTAEPAWAAPANFSGYVCSVRYSRQSNVFYGSTGYLVVSLRTAGLCGGSVVGSSFIVKSSGGSIPGYSFSEAERLGLMSELMQASRQATQVTIRADDVDFGVYDVTFRAN